MLTTGQRWIIVGIVILGFVFNARTQCDESLTAKPGTYLLKMNPEKTDVTVAPYTTTNCYYLEQIEASREFDQDIELVLGNYVIIVFSKKKLITIKSNEE